MERRLKERLIGASVLVMLAVILIPMILDDTSRTETRITQTNIPARPDDGFTSKIVPLPEPGEREPGSPHITPAPPAVEEPAAPAPAPAAQAPATGAQATPPHTANAASAPDRVGVAAWIVQLGSFSSEENANSLSLRLRQAGYAAFVEPVGEGGNQAYRVRVGPELLKSDAQALSDRLKANMHLDGIVLNYP